MSILNTIKFIANHPLNKGNKLSSFVRFARWQLSSMINPYPVIHPFIENTKLIMWKGLHGATGNLYVGLDEFEDMSFLLHFLRENDLFIDVGANIGSYTVLASGVVGANSISIEPVPETFINLTNNIRINGIENKIEALNIGIGSEKKFLKFTQNLDSVNHVAISNETNTIEVQIDTLDEISKSHRDKVCLMKIDVEGFETEVLNGGFETLNNENLKAIIIELIGSGSKFGFSEDNINENLLNLGYKSYKYDPFRRKLFSYKYNEERKTLNVIYLKDLNFIIQRLETAKKHKIFKKEV